MSLEELDQEPFSVHEFVERLAWKTMGSKAGSNPEDFDPMKLHTAFEKMIGDLQKKNEDKQKRIEQLENSCKEEEKKHWQRVMELQKKNQALYTNFQKLDERISYVATKVVHLGDQLEGVNTPRARAVEAQRLMNYLAEFLSGEALKSAILTDPFQLQLAADIIQKLHLIALELPVGGKFDRARQKIAEKYDNIERELIGEFKNAHREKDLKKMKKIASVMTNFKGYGQCIDAFITESQRNAFLKPNIFDDVLPLCEKTNEVVHAVFVNPENVMGKFVQNIFQTKIQNHISKELGDRSDPVHYLKNLNDLYSRTTKLIGELSGFKFGNDSSLLNKLTRGIFQSHLDSYIDIETRYLRDRCTILLHRYYESKEHQKKQIQSGGIHDLKRDIQAKIGKANINIGPAIEDYGGEIFLSEVDAINILQETKMAFKRCQMLSNPSDLGKNAAKIFDVLSQYLVIEHIDYALELGLQAIPLSDPKTEPEIYYFDVINQANSLFQFVEKQFMDSLVPLILSSPMHGVCLKRKRELREMLETKIDVGVDRALNSIIGWIRHILSTEQKKTDFKPETDDAPMLMLSPACEKVVKFLTKQARSIRRSVDGKNIDVVMMELGKRFHRLIYEHVLQFQYNIIGAMLVICDVNEYRKVVKEEFQVPLLSRLFEKLHGLCNLLVVVPENLKTIITGDQLIELDEAVVLSFLERRSDYRTAKIASLIKR
ncbi:hypothetical protein LOTGIDRAFT_215620 [Lottia gigantea]|uniref:Exocyst complex component 5 n=1 Tax=Lottia gigantea TaxID=225164 RepID=V3ZRV1_LOTGI|nr:hypothetical protein LOTGIDRAFT_215620 [Lottia gigantea]ESO94153.1 hypothetical protein LOTGIDRAFT_215620 [Lottia gigantea]